MLDEFITANRMEIIRRCRAKVAARSIPPPTTVEIEHGVPLFLTQLVGALRLGLAASSAEIGASATRHGHDLLRRGFTVSQVVHDYGDVCQAITELAADRNVAIDTNDFRVLNRCLDDAIANAVTQYAREDNASVADADTGRGGQRLEFFAHELRNLINTALVAFDVLKSGSVGARGSTGTVLSRSLHGLRALVGRALAEVRLTEGIHHREPFLISTLIDELAHAAALDAHTRNIRLLVAPIEQDVTVEADRQILSAVVINLLQNAFKFTRPQTTVTLRVVADTERVRIEIQDECGGLQGNADDLFRPFEQRSADRTGLGLGLAFCRWGVESNGGQIHAYTLPGIGCVFTVDLPCEPVATAPLTSPAAAPAAE
jgi:signal transduction histidine kinase